MSEPVRKDKIAISQPGRLSTVLLFSCSFLRSKEAVFSLLARRMVLLNDAIVTEDVIVQADDELVLCTPQSAEPSVRTDYEIIYEDAVCLAVHKPSPLPVHPAGKYYFNTLVSLLRKDNRIIYPVTRLDKETSGIVLFATSPAHAKALQTMLQRSDCVKTYIAVVFGEVKPLKGVINKPLCKTTLGMLRDHMVVSKQGKPSTTAYEVLATHQGFSLLRLTLLTGRRHQLRAHLASIGHPIVGDKQYGSSPDLFVSWQAQPRQMWDALKKKVLTSRQLLHCSRISFKHPQTGKIISISAKTSQDILHFLKETGFKSSLRF